MTLAQIQAIRAVARAIVEAIDAAGTLGAPAGTLYAALMSQGCSLTQFDSLTAGLQRAGLVTREGDLFRATDKGRAFAAQV